jgi:hypothetical protein
MHVSLEGEGRKDSLLPGGRGEGVSEAIASALHETEGWHASVLSITAENGL